MVLYFSCVAKPKLFCLLLCCVCLYESLLLGKTALFLCRSENEVQI